MSSLEDMGVDMKDKNNMFDMIEMLDMVNK